MSLFRLFPFVLVSLCFTLAKSAPLPNADPSLISFERRDAYVYSLAERFLNDLADRDISEDNIFARDVTSRSFHPVEEQTLVRRTEGVGAKTTGQSSDKIHVDIGKKLDKGMKVMGNIQDPLGNAAGATVKKAIRRT